MNDNDAIRQELQAELPGIRADLERLVRIPSISFPHFDPNQVERSADLTEEIFQASGAETRILRVAGAHPAVYGSIPTPAGAPTVLLYAHHDVQPVGPGELWDSPPFEPIQRDGRLFGRGVADDKANIAVHAAALRVWRGRPPVGIRIFVEGEEESTSKHLEAFLTTYRELLSADVAIIADGQIWRAGEPALMTSLRGIVSCFIEVRTLDHAVHSGDFGGAIPDALTVLIRTLATLQDDRGVVAIPGLVVAPAFTFNLTEEELRELAGLRPGVQMIGEGSLTERLWTRPAISILAIDAPHTAEASNQLVPVARAKVSLRIAPGQDASDAREALVSHLRGNVPWGAEVRIVPDHTGPGHRISTDDSSGHLAYKAMKKAMEEAWLAPLIDIGAGGSNPFLAAYVKAFPNAACLITGPGDQRSNVHAENENLDLRDFERACLAEALFFRYLADPAAATSL